MDSSLRSAEQRKSGGRAGRFLWSCLSGVADVFRLTRDWFVRARDDGRRFFFGDGPCSFCDFAILEGGEPREVTRAKRYRFPRLFKVVCPCVIAAETSGTQRCRHADSKDRKSWHMVPVGMLLLFFWGGIFVWFISCLPEVPPTIAVAVPVEDRVQQPERKKDELTRLLREGERYFSEGNYPLAKERFVAARSMDLWSAEIRCRIAACDLEMGETDLAMSEYERCKERGIATLNVYHGQAEAYLRVLKAGRARDVLEKSLTLEKVNPQTARLMMLSYEGMVQLSEAEQEARMAGEIGEDDPEILAQVAAFYRRQNKLGKAYEVLERALEAGPQSVAAIRESAFLLNEDKRYKDAKIYAVFAEGLEPDSEVEALLVELSLKEASMEERLAAYRSMIEKRPGFHELTLQTAQALLDEGRTHQAIELLKPLANHRSPAVSVQALEMLGVAHLNSKNFVQARDYGERVIALNYYSLVGRWVVMDSFVGEGNQTGAIEALDGILRIVPDDLNAKLTKALLYLEGGEHLWAEEWLHQIADQHRENTEALYMLGAYYLERLAYPKARKIFSEVQRRQPEDAVAADYLKIIDEILSAPGGVENSVKG